MQIQVKCNCGEEKCEEWAIIEVQGIVEAQPDFQDRLQNLHIGLLCRPSQENYTFTIGYHELSGSKVQLKKPFLVLKKVKIEADVDMMMVGDGDDDDDDCLQTRVELRVVGIIRHQTQQPVVHKKRVTGGRRSSYVKEGRKEARILSILFGYFFLFSV
ncbi:hypothetical protein ACFE04_028536 [Oxalis oulophora]